MKVVLKYIYSPTYDWHLRQECSNMLLGSFLEKSSTLTETSDSSFSYLSIPPTWIAFDSPPFLEGSDTNKQTNCLRVWVHSLQFKFFTYDRNGRWKETYSVCWCISRLLEMVGAHASVFYDFWITSKIPW